MTKCLDEDAILALLGGDLDVAALRDAEAHIDGCPECRRVVAALAIEQGSGGGRRSAELGSIVDGRFFLETVAGSGGMGRVYSAIDLRANTRIALKRVDVDDVRFAREARVLAELAHPAIVRHVADGRCEDGSRYLAMEWLEGEDLAQRLKRGPLSVEETIALGTRVSDALAAAHEAGIVHRDIKPSNLFLVGGRVSEVKIVDFGLARAPAAETVRTRTGSFLGTPGYMAPEQARGEAIGPSADVFALGCVLYECLTGERAFKGTHLVAVLSNLLTGATPRPRTRVPRVPRALDALVVRMLSRQPSQRPESGSEMVRELAMLDSWRALARPMRPLWIAAGVIATTVTIGSLAVVRARPHAVSTTTTTSAAVPVIHAITDHVARDGTPPEAAREYALGLQALRDAALNRARDHLKRAVERDPTLASAHLRLSVWTDAVMDPAQSRTHFQAARANVGTLEPREQELLTAIEPAFLLEPPDMEEVKRRVRALGTRYPEDAELGLLAAGVRWATAPSDYDRALAIDPKFAYAWYSRAQLQFKLGDAAGARASLDTCLAAAPSASLCVLLRARIDARQGRCEDMERDARAILAIENGSDYGYAHLANALAARGADRGAVAEAVHARALATSDESLRRKREVYDEAQLAVAFGDFAEAERQGRALRDLVKNESFEQEHILWATFLVDLLEERGDDLGAGRVADDFLHRSAAWRSVASRTPDDPKPMLLVAAARAGLRSDADLARERAAWIAEWGKRLGPNATEELWVEGWARPARKPKELKAAIAAMPESASKRPVSPGVQGWVSPFGFSTAYAGRVQLASGHLREAADTLGGVARSCSVLADAIGHTRSKYWLGLASEKLGDRETACASYSGVIARWGHARSITADAARARMRVLRCDG
jgi:Tfp pilus assembly protein PilF